MCYKAERDGFVQKNVDEPNTKKMRVDEESRKERGVRKRNEDQRDGRR